MFLSFEDVIVPTRKSKSVSPLCSLLLFHVLCNVNLIKNRKINSNKINSRSKREIENESVSDLSLTSDNFHMNPTLFSRKKNIFSSRLRETILFTFEVFQISLYSVRSRTTPFDSQISSSFLLKVQSTL